MKKLSLLLSSLALMAACQSPKSAPAPSSADSTTTDSLAADSTTQQADTVPYTLAQGYFLRNDTKQLPPLRIDTQAEFERYFGMAAHMGEEGTPTAIDFSQQFVIAIAKAECDRPTQFVNISLRKAAQADSLSLSYQTAQTKAPAGYTSSALSLLIVSKQYAAPVSVAP